MNKFTKGALIAAGCFFVGGVILGTIGAAGRIYTGESMRTDDDLGFIQDTLYRAGKWNLRWKKGLTLEYGGIEYDSDHENSIVSGDFTDDSLRETEIYNLDIEIGGGTLTIWQGDGLELKKKGGPACQYYIEGDTFYLKQKGSVAKTAADLTLTLPEGIVLDAVEIEMGAGTVATKDILTAETIEIEVDAGEILMEEVKADSFCAKVAVGSVTVDKLDAKECEAEVSMGEITLQNSLVTDSLGAEVSMGEINIFLRDSYENHDYEIECGMGDVTISPEDGALKEYAGLGNTVDLYGRNSGRRSVYSLECSMGSIYVEFAGQEL